MHNIPGNPRCNRNQLAYINPNRNPRSTGTRDRWRVPSGAAVEDDEVGGAEGAPETRPRRLGRGGAAEEGAAEVGELGAEGGERGVEISPVLGDVAMAPTMVVVMAAQLAVLELGGGWRLRLLRRHRGGSRVCAACAWTEISEKFQNLGPTSLALLNIGLNSSAFHNIGLHLRIILFHGIMSIFCHFSVSFSFLIPPAKKLPALPLLLISLSLIDLGTESINVDSSSHSPVYLFPTP